MKSYHLILIIQIVICTQVFSSPNQDNQKSSETVPNKPGSIQIFRLEYYNLSWNDKSDNEDFFSLERSLNNDSNYIEIARIEKNSNRYEDKDTMKGQTYYYRIRGGNSFGYSEYVYPAIRKSIKTWSKEAEIIFGIVALIFIIFIFGKFISILLAIKHINYFIGTVSMVNALLASIAFALPQWISPYNDVFIFPLIASILAGYGIFARQHSRFLTNVSKIRESNLTTGKKTLPCGTADFLIIFYVSITSIYVFNNNGFLSILKITLFYLFIVVGQIKAAHAISNAEIRESYSTGWDYGDSKFEIFGLSSLRKLDFFSVVIAPIIPFLVLLYFNRGNIWSIILIIVITLIFLAINFIPDMNKEK